MKKYINISTLYILLWVLYDIHWCCAGSTPIDGFSNIILLVCFVVSIYYFFYAMKHYGATSFFKQINLLLVMFLVYGVAYSLFGENVIIASKGVIKKGSYLVAVLRTFLPIYAFYCFFKKRYLTESSLKIYAIFFIVSTYYMFRLTLGDREMDFTNNIGYWFTYIIPFVYLWRNRPIFQYVLLSILLLFIILCVKRGAIIISALLVFYMIHKSLAGSPGRKRRNLLFAAIALSVAIIYIPRVASSSELFMKRWDYTMEGNDSGRSSIWEACVNNVLYDSSVLEILFGHGADSTIRVAGNYAHNDWIEILVNNGLFGVVIFLFFFVSFYKQTQKFSKRNKEESFYMGSALIICFASTIFSMFYSSTPIYVTIMIGYSLFLMSQTDDMKNLTTEIKENKNIQR